MTKEIWINLPVKDIKRSKEFFTQLGFKLNTRFGEQADTASFLVGSKGVVLMLCNEKSFRGYTGNAELSNAFQSAEVLLSIDAESQAEVDEMAEKAVAAGGSSNHKPYEMTGFMYGCLFSDPDGHRWNVLYMDWNKLPK